MRLALLLMIFAVPAFGQGFELDLKVKQKPAPVQVRQVPVSQCQSGQCGVVSYRLVPVSVAPPVIVAAPPPVLIAAPAPLYEVRYGIFGRPRLARVR